MLDKGKGQSNMASTPEGAVKKAVRDVLDGYPDLYYEMPVPTGYGRSGLDFTCCYRSIFFAIETKAPGKKPTLRQGVTAERIRQGGGVVFIIDGTASENLALLKLWLLAMSGQQPMIAVNRAAPIPQTQAARRPI